MLRNKLYYWTKPFVPRSIRLHARRWFALRRLKEVAEIWPILPDSEIPPVGWPGWPDGKKFSFVITHDVEGPEGLAKCRQLAEFEMVHGFRSSFNFIPEGSYIVPPDLRAWLISNGFEVGVHDLHHDGKLYSSRKQFAENARKINAYLKDWGAVGYRSGFMLRNLDWHHDIEVEYDASTFDTDPFEPQPGGAGTIFPFWIHDKSASLRSSYLELPYTLAQDSTLFLLFQEKTAAIWIKKLDWIAQHNGMALVNVHPDYLQFDVSKSSPNTFPIKLYGDLLEAVRSKYEGEFWSPLPRQLAAWYRNACPPSPKSALAFSSTSQRAPQEIAGLKHKRAAILLYSNFPNDPRPYRASQAMVESGMEVDMFCLGDKLKQPPLELLHGVNVKRIFIQHRRSGALMYMLQYGRFIGAAFWFLTWRSVQRKYDIVHVHNMPDILVFSALIPKLRGAKVVLDLHDPMPELMMTIYNVKPGSAWVSFLKRLEKWSMRFANSVVTVNEACRKIFAARSCPVEKIHVVMNAPDEAIFTPHKTGTDILITRNEKEPFVIMYHGSLVERHGLDLAIAALDKIKAGIPKAELRIYGNRNAYLDSVLASPTALRLGKSVEYFGSKNQKEIVDAINQCDVGIIPNRRSIFTELNTPTRIFEYLSQSKAVIAPRAPGIQDYFGPEDLVYFELGDMDDLAEKIVYVYEHPAAIHAIVKRGQAVYRNHDWSRERGRLMNLFTQTLGAKNTSVEALPGEYQ